MADIEKISRGIIKLKNLELRLHVNMFSKDKKYYHNEYTYDDKTYIKLTPYTFLTLDMYIEDLDFKDTNIFISQSSLVQVKNGFKRMLDNIYRQKIFAMRNNEVITYPDMVKKYTEVIKLVDISKAIVIEPSVVYDENEVSYEGVTIYLNRKDVFTQLPISESESLVYARDKVDLFIYSQLLINYFKSKENNSNNVSTHKPRPTKNIFGI